MYMHLKTETQIYEQKLKKWKGKIDNSTIIVGDFNISFSVMDRTTRLKINKEIKDLNNL